MAIAIHILYLALVIVKAVFFLFVWGVVVVFFFIESTNSKIFMLFSISRLNKEMSNNIYILLV